MTGPTPVSTADPRWWIQSLRRFDPSERKVIWILLGVSLLWRLLAWHWTVDHDVPLRGDEIGYFDRAVAFAAIFSNLIGGQWPQVSTWIQAYGEGRWTPLQPILLSFGLLIGNSVAAARLVPTLLSAATTPLVYVLARKIGSKRVALIAGGLHACYPTFVAYAHYLWTETAFAMFLVTALIFALSTRDAASESRRLRWGALAGLMIGVCFLIKPSGLFLMPVIPLWFCLRTRARVQGARVAAAFVLAWLIPWGAWSVTASTVEGRMVVAGTTSGHCLYLGNNPWIPQRLGTYSSPETKQRMRESVDALVGSTGVTSDDAARTLARREVLGHPLRFVGRVMRRVQEYWFPDSFPLVHLYRGYYPPLSWAAGLAIGLIIGVCYLALMVLVGRGLLTPGAVSWDLRALWLGLVVMSMAPSLLVVAQSRYHMPALVILLPFAALAIDRIRTRLGRSREFAWIAGSAAFLLVVANGVPNLIKHHFRPSSYYSDVFRPLGSIVDVHFVDQIAFRTLDGAHRSITLSLLGGDAAFYHTGEAVATWNTAEDPPAITGFVHSDLDATPLRMSITVEGDDPRSVVIEPIAANAWRRWQPTGLDGIEFRWEPTSVLVPTRVYFPQWPGEPALVENRARHGFVP